MKLENGNISIFCGGDNNTRIEIRDSKANTQFCTITLTNDQLAKALSRLAHVKCDIEVRYLDKIGKTHESITRTFILPYKETSYKIDKERANNYIQTILDEENEGWISDNYFGSQNSTFTNDDKKACVNMVIRRWV